MSIKDCWWLTALEMTIKGLLVAYRLGNVNKGLLVAYRLGNVNKGLLVAYRLGNVNKRTVGGLPPWKCQ